MSKLHFPPIKNQNVDQPWPGERTQYHPPKIGRRRLYIQLVFLGLTAIVVSTGVIAANVKSEGTEQQALSASTVAASATAPDPDLDLSDATAANNTGNAPPEDTLALKKGKCYLETLHMSRKGLFKQLTSDVDKFTPEAAQYAIDNVDNTDWDKAALTKAKSYVKTMSLSPDAIRGQLISDAEGFSPGEADYAIQHLND
ncbi:Ltp family lipoprotein [Rothia koreensis]|uniref:Ltp family lipoprotein n=1 Tax=Rothia koreensis TaxID=592378 RepID=UPI003FCC8F37